MVQLGEKEMRGLKKREEGGGEGGGERGTGRGEGGEAEGRGEEALPGFGEGTIAISSPGISCT